MSLSRNTNTGQHKPIQQNESLYNHEACEIIKVSKKEGYFEKKLYDWIMVVHVKKKKGTTWGNHLFKAKTNFDDNDLVQGHPDLLIIIACF